METNDYRFVLVMQATTKITQMMGRSGNELLINRVDLLHQGRLASVPAISSNSMRHNVVREPGGMWLIDEYDLTGKLTKEMLRLLVGGGNNASQSGGAESLARFAAMRQCLPLLGLMGCGLPDSPKPGTLKFSDAYLVCEETRGLLATIAPELELPEFLRPARTCVGKWTNYRHDPVQRQPGKLDEKELTAEQDNSSMPYGGEAIVAGSLFAAEIWVQDCTPVELGALLWSLRIWARDGGFVGGMSAKGNGRTTAMLVAPEGLDMEAAQDGYTTYAMSQREEAWKWLQETYGGWKTKGKKRKQEELAL